jgi:two-component system CAI-1 autoinducer sensor kinase/phosphatase CqsS
MVSHHKGLLRLLGIRSRAIWREFIHQLVIAPMEPVLHASGRRLIWLGSYVVAAHLGFWWVWSSILPQPYENAGLRLAFALMGILLIFMGFKTDSSSPGHKLIATLIFWLQLPCFTFFMYLANDRNSVWLATVVAILLIYHNITDWRIASIGTTVGLAISWLFFHWTLTSPPFPLLQSAHNEPGVDAFVIGFAWAVGAMLGISVASRQKEQLTQTLATMGIMAHELRTPLSSIGLIANALDRLALTIEDPYVKARVTELSLRTQNLTVQMNHQIDTQIVNARLEHLPITLEPVSASDLVNGCLRHYPFKSKKESRCWSVDIAEDFVFSGPKSQMEQVLSNLIKNAITALRKANSDFESGAMTIRVYVDQKKGYITVKDKGTGIDPKLHRSIFEPFFSTNHNTGHGLGLAFCRKVVRAAGGNLFVLSQPGEGACFYIELPL